MTEDEDKDFVLLPHYSGNPVGLHGEGLSCDQFCAIVESQIETFSWTDQDAFSYALEALTSPASDWADQLGPQMDSWSRLKDIMKSKFQRLLTIQMKAELRKSLRQDDKESASDFYLRCKEAEKLICDAEMDNAAFERDVLLTFLIGLRDELQRKVMQSEGSSLDDFLQEAISLEGTSGSDVKLELSDGDDFDDIDDFIPDEDDDEDDQDWEDRVLKPPTSVNSRADRLTRRASLKQEDKENSVKKEPETSMQPDISVSAETETTSHEASDDANSDEKHQCHHCDMLCKTEKQLKTHVKSKHADQHDSLGGETEKLKCSTCSATFKTSRMLRLHIYKSHTENSQYTCQSCAQDFYDLKKFVLHQIKLHAERSGDQIFCLACRRPYTKSHSLQVHMIRKHYKEKPFPCDQCDKKFFTITDAQKHIKIVHLNEKPFACEKCGKQYSTSGGLLIHNRSAHGDKGEWLQCDQCDKKFAYKQILQAHILNNHDKGNFMCDECGVPYNTKSTLRQHKMAVHPLTNNGQTYPCLHSGCTRVFKVAAKLRMHDDVVHKNLEGKYKCAYCPKRFWGKSSLREHTNGVHLNTKPHKCSLCDFASSYRNILREHIRATHEQRKFSCPMCNHRSSYKNNLEKHIKNVHSSAKSSNNASSGIMQQQPQTGQPLVQPQQPQDTQSLDLVALTPGPPQPQVQIQQAPQHAPALC